MNRISLLPLAAALVLSGCASSMSGIGGTENHRCPMPEGGACQSILDNYEQSVSGDGRVTSVAQKGERADNGAAAPRVVTLAPGFGEAMNGAPLMTTPRVLRIYIAPWRDSDDNLMDGRRVYARIDEGRWRIDHFDASVRRELEARTALRPPPNAVGAAPESEIAPALRRAGRAAQSFFDGGAAPQLGVGADAGMQLPGNPAITDLGHGFAPLVGDGDGDDW